MEKVYCEWESKEFDRDQFAVYKSGPLLKHLHVSPEHTTNGIEIGGSGPSTEGVQPDGISYGSGPMAPPPDRG